MIRHQQVRCRIFLPSMTLSGEDHIVSSLLASPALSNEVVAPFQGSENA